MLCYGAMFPLQMGSEDEFAAVRGVLDQAGDSEALRALFVEESAVADPPPGVDALSALGLVERTAEGGYSATVSLRRVAGLHIAADKGATARRALPDVVYPATERTLEYLDSLPELACERFLDLGSGTGVAALWAARHGTGEAWACDITGRATHFAEFNRLLNGIENARALCGDLYEPARGMRFDRIASHPPYVPVADATFVFRDGGEDGEQILRRIIQGLPGHLEPGGRFYGYGMASDRKGESLEQRMRKWLGPYQGEFDILLVAESIHTPDTIRGPKESEREHWARVFEKYGVEYLFFGSMLLERHAQPRDCYTIRRQSGPRSGWRETEWLRALMASMAEDPARILDMRPVLSPEVEAHVDYEVREGAWSPEGCTLVNHYPFEAEIRCAPWVMQLAGGCDGRRSGRDHAAGAREIPAEQIIEVLWALISGGFVRTPEFLCP